ncbi:hypothetical protein [Pseudomonas gessardii]|uniref:Uncharacterized protein n=1 Tax=Pseudomonas gessardii TaxID=78544 RepID=A0A7Y1MPY5_9PSED|nr:hypothetical protein [Pseudomonas gessardii]NNA96144.1 hypothetical protein [Pseudomonas gessardii]
MSINAVGGGRGGGLGIDGGMQGMQDMQGMQGNIVGKEATLGQQQDGAQDLEALTKSLTKSLAQILANAGRTGGSPGSGDSSGGDEDDQGQQMSGQKKQSIQMPQENNNSVNFG